MSNSTLPVAIIGAGPVGLAAAAHLIERGETPLILEAGDSVAASVRKWGHVRIFSPWEFNVDPAAAALLADSGWSMPNPAAYPTGAELVSDYLEPLAALPAIQPHLQLATRVVAVARLGFDKMKTAGREDAPFLLTVERADGTEDQLLAKAVIDASGTYDSPNPLGANGTPALGEKALAGQIFYGIPDVLGRDRQRYAGRAVLVVGSGHSAFNTILDLVSLASDAPDTRITWAVRRGAMSAAVYGGGANDQLVARGALGHQVERLVDSGQLELVTGFKIQRLARSGGQISVIDGEVAIGPFDEIVATTGFRPDLGLLQELRLDLDPAVESPAVLAPMIDPNLHSCGTVRPHGAEQLKHPDSNIYIVGMKSYGRAPTFLMRTGYEQVRSVVAAISGDWEAARRVELTLPETGVCTSDFGVKSALGGTSACCGAAPANGADIALVAAGPAVCCG
jgi:thioredoxin reductase